ncbi:MAG: hypothetical protein ACEY3L_21645 [Wolbachia sp.]
MPAITNVDNPTLAIPNPTPTVNAAITPQITLVFIALTVMFPPFSWEMYHIFILS